MYCMLCKDNVLSVTLCLFYESSFSFSASRGRFTFCSHSSLFSLIPASHPMTAMWQLSQCPLKTETNMRSRKVCWHSSHTSAEDAGKLGLCLFRSRRTTWSYISVMTHQVTFNYLYLHREPCSDNRVQFTASSVEETLTETCWGLGFISELRCPCRPADLWGSLARWLDPSGPN